ncbi:MAG: sodium:solute symporter, partial [Planctomycetota bacterium]
GWQGPQGYTCCAKDAHEAKMAGVLNGWRYRVLLVFALVTPFAVRTFLDHPDFAEQAAVVHQSLEAIQTDTPEQLPAMQSQMRTPLALAAMLPVGLLGLMCAAMLAAFISTHDTYLHSWGSILVQDVILPFRKKPFTQRQHLWLLRLSIFAVAIFIFCFSLLFRQTQFIAMFCVVTASIFVGGAGSVIIGGLYWKHGTTQGAWSAMITGMTFSLAGIVINQYYPDFPLTGQEMSFVAIVLSVGMYLLVSLLGPRAMHNMDRLLHRGKYAVAGESSTSLAEARTWLEKLGFDREFTGWDRVVTFISVGWPLLWTLVFVAGTVYCLLRQAGGHEVSNDAWLTFWQGFLWITYVASILVTFWYAIGGMIDIKYLYSTLRTRNEEPHDDGRVVQESSNKE